MYIAEQLALKLGAAFFKNLTVSFQYPYIKKSEKLEGSIKVI